MKASECPRADNFSFFKHPAQVVAVGKTYQFCYFGNGNFWFCDEKFLGPRYPERDEVLKGAHAQGLLEHFAEILRRDADKIG